MGLVTKTALFSPKSQCALVKSTISWGESSRTLTFSPLPREKKAGNSPVLYPTTGTAIVSRYSNVAGKSKMDLAPAQTTIMGVSERACKSVDISMCPSRWTPPIPPVANTRIPACSAASIVPATVVPPSNFLTIALAKSRRLTFTGFLAFASLSSSLSLIPTRIFPSSNAIVAGTAPCSRTFASISRANSIFCGMGSPCVMTVDSSATMGRASSRARVISGERVMWGFFI